MLEIWRAEKMHKSSLWSIFNISSFLGPLQTSISICRILMNQQLRHECIVLKHIPSFIFNAHWNEVKFIDRDPYYHMRRVKEAIHIRLHPNNINRDSGIEIPERQESRTAADCRGSKSLSEQQGLKCTNQSCWKNNLSQQSIMLYRIMHDQLTSSPEED